jgi:hypothetical protein|tara:strand:- start:2179 stop:3576 length:1398 start_codon:yes stop_codon:yes gene_type:complete
MAQWRKVIVSGSNAVLNEISASGAITPTNNDGVALGTETRQFSDLFLAEGAVINFDAGDFTATQANNLLTLSGGNTRVDKLEIDGANDSIDVSTDMVITAAADITLAAGGANVKPNADSSIDLGISGTAFRKLFVDDIDLANQGSIAGAVHISGSGNITGSDIYASSNVDVVGRVDVLSHISSSASITGSNVYAEAGFDTAGTITLGTQLAVGHGGTGLNTTTAKAVVITNDSGGTNALATVAMGTNGQLLIGGSNGPAVAVPTGGDGLSVTVGDGTLEYDLDAALTTVTSVKNNSLIIGGNSQNNTIDFGTDDVILFDTDNTERMRVDAAGVDITGALTVSTNATIEGNLIVNGDTTTLSNTNVAVGDSFIFLATGSAGSNVDAGIIVQSGSAVDSGSALYHDINSQRWSVAKQIKDTSTAIAPSEFVVTVKALGDDGAPVEADKEYGVGEMAINNNGDIWIYS